MYVVFVGRYTFVPKMKKAVLHIFFLLTLLSASIGHAVTPANSAASGVVQKMAKAAIAKTILDSDACYQKDLLIDTNDYNESDADDHGSVKGKTLSVSNRLLIADLLVLDFDGKSCSIGSYTKFHFSRLPRYDYIALNVFRI